MSLKSGQQTIIKDPEHVGIVLQSLTFGIVMFHMPIWLQTLYDKLILDLVEEKKMERRFRQKKMYLPLGLKVPLQGL